ncbi:tagaturonate reductase [uncultured Cedecea sp.]|uniref:tagaturonate reductase n=1 Tax=uncultured Cedecea sp. TaxID=988762 RepID=UPI002619AD54|nr:tagaturonate reductase [uncultured Cedecea sp.]
MTITLNRTNFPGPQYTTRIMQFGEGNFLRAFVDWQIDLLNEKTGLDAGIAVIRPLNSDFPPSMNTQDGLYTTVVRGLTPTGEAVSDIRMIRSINEEINIYQNFDDYISLSRDENIQFIFSNTTEAGISYHSGDKLSDAPPVSFPAKLTVWLYERYQYFQGDSKRGVTIIPCELIDYNGQALQSLVQRYAKEWQLPVEFLYWLEHSNPFCSTLVDRIVTGYPREQAKKFEQSLGYHDQFLDTAEYFYLFVIQGPESLKTALHLDKLDLNVLITDDIKPYKERKVAILNGAHTALVPVAYLSGIDTVGAAMEDEQVFEFVEQTIYQDIVPVLSLPQAELDSFAQSVLQRFKNPYIQHQLLSISLNSMTKYRTRILPQVIRWHEEQGKLPHYLIFSLAALIVFYRGTRGDETIPLSDDAIWLSRFNDLWHGYEQQKISLQELVRQVLDDREHWQYSLLSIPGFAELTERYVSDILYGGMRQALKNAF